MEATQEISERKKKLRREVTAVKRKIASTEKELQEVNTKISKSRSDYTARRRRAEKNALDIYVASEMRPYEQSLLLVQDRIKKLENTYQNDLDNLTEENLMKQSSNKQEIINEVKQSVTKLHNTVLEVIDERFLNELESQLDEHDYSLDTDDLDPTIAYFNACDNEIRKISKYSGVINRFLLWLQGLFVELDLGSFNFSPIVSTIMIIASICILYLCYRFFFPFYLILIGTCMVFNLLRNYKILKIILAHKAVQDNVDEIESKIRADVLAELDRQTKQLNSSFENNMQKLKEQEAALKKVSKDTSLNAKKSFQFDDSKIAETYQTSLSQQEHEQEELTKRLTELNSQLSSLKNDIKILAKDAGNAIAAFQKSYLDPNKIGSSIVFKGKFLIDVVNNAPVYFEHPKTSCLFLYQSKELMQNFIRLLILQLRAELKPTMLLVDLYDVKTLGAAFLNCKPKALKDSEQSTIGRLFTIYTSEQEFKKHISEYTADIKSKTFSILAEHQNIDAYNQFMVKLDSLPVPFTFSFLIDPSDQILGQEELLQILESGGNVGSYVHIFLDEDMFFKSGDRYKKFIDAVGKICALRDNEINSFSKEFLLEKLEK